MNLSNFTVTEKAKRPACTKPQCFYCNQKMGEKHLLECVLIKKTVIVKTTIEYQVDIPAHWTAEMLEAHRNESSSCADNILDDIAAYKALLNSNGYCLCGHTDTVMVTDSTFHSLKE